MNPHKKHTGGWKGILQKLVDENNTMKVSHRGSTSYSTRDKRADTMFLMIETLRTELHFKIEDPHNLKEKHVETLVKYWREENYAPTTIRNSLSYLRTLCGWMGKHGMVMPLQHYAPDMEVIQAAQKDKSWSGNNVNFWEVYDKVTAKDKFVGMQLLAIAAFGLRLKEAVMFQPLVCGREGFIELIHGTKGGRPRRVAIDDEFKRAVIQSLKNYAATRIGRGKAHIGHPDKTLIQNLKRYHYVLRTCGVSKKGLGVTGHGLRTEFVIDELAKRGMVATVRGGSGKVDIVPANVSEPEKEK